MKFAICDDEELSRKEVLDTVSEYSKCHPEHPFEFAEFSCGEDLLSAAEKIGGYDVYILDIIMPYMNGIDLGKELRKQGYDGQIIYLTSSKDYAIDSFKTRPFSYILKPFDKKDFCGVLDEALGGLFEHKNKCIIVKTQKSRIKLTLNQILYAELNRRTILYHLIDGKTVESIHIRTTFTEAVQELIRDKRFFLCGAGNAVNLHHILEVENETLVFQNSHRLYLGKKICREVRSAWYDYNFDVEEMK